MKPIRFVLACVILISACAPRVPLPTATEIVEVSPAPPLVVTATLLPQPVQSGTITPESTARHLRIFEQLWNTVDTQYVYPDFHGVDWEAAYSEFESRIESGLSDEIFWQAMREMVDRLADDHSAFLTPSEAREEDDQLSGTLAYVGIGVYAAAQDDKEQAVIFHVFPGSPAAEAGLRVHDAILRIDGQRVVDADGTEHLDWLRGPTGTSTVLTVRSPGAAPREVTVTRRRISGTLHSTGRVLPVEAANQSIGYIMIPTLWDTAIEDSTRQVLRDLTSGGQLDGLIVDMRINAGGSSNNLLALLGFFTAGQHGEFAGRDQTRPLEVVADPIGNSQNVPLVILISPDTQSYAEVLSGVLREAGRAQLVGQTTAGNIETIYGYDFEDGSRAWIARETFIPPSGDDWETTGLIPDVTVAADWDEFADQDDPYIAAALDLLTQPVGTALPPN